MFADHIHVDPIDCTQLSDGSVWMPDIDRECGVSRELPNERFGVSKTNQKGINGSRPAFIALDEIAKAKQYIKSHGKLGMIIIDYLQLMTPSEKTNNREQEVASVSRELKAIAKELDIPVMALAQVARSVTQSVDKRPDLSHLRESGSIEQDADVVMAIYRPSYYFEYGQHPDGKDSSGKYNQDNIGQTEYEQASELLILKNRNGVAFGAIDEKFIGMYSTFKSAEEASEPIYQDNSDIIPFDNDPF